MYAQQEFADQMFISGNMDGKQCTIMGRADETQTDHCWVVSGTWSWLERTDLAMRVLEWSSRLEVMSRTSSKVSNSSSELWYSCPNESEGDRVAIECGIPCSKPSCYFCRTGQYNACPDVVFFSTPPHHGTLRRYHVHPEAWLHRLPDSLTFEEGSLLEPLSVALAGIDRSNVRLGDPLVICGAGPIGLVCLLAANAAGAAPITITDIDENRLQRAKELVPRVKTVRVEPKESAQELGKKIVQALGCQAKLILECTGVESSIHAGIYVSHDLAHDCRFRDHC